MNWRILHGDSLEVLRRLPAESIQCAITSPPYYGLRDYGVDGQVGLEPTVKEYLDRLMDLFAEVKRALKPDGVCFVNLGDSYSGSGNGSGDKRPAGSSKSVYCDGVYGKHKPTDNGIPKKSLMNVPGRFAIRMTDELGWIQRNEIIWHKPACMPYSGKDRFTVDFEPIYFFAKSPKYKFNQILEPLAESTKNDKRTVNKDFTEKRPDRDFIGAASRGGGMLKPTGDMRNKRTVWNVAFEPQKEKHFASYPTKLIEPMLLAGTNEGDIVLDPFCGTGTTGIVALRNNRQFLGIELNPDYIAISEKRLKNV